MRSSSSHPKTATGIEVWAIERLVPYEKNRRKNDSARKLGISEIPIILCEPKRVILVWIDKEGRRTKVADSMPHLPDRNRYDSYMPGCGGT